VIVYVIELKVFFDTLPTCSVDFYPNGGRVQHGCQNLFLGAVTDIAGIWTSSAKAEGRSLCNHRRAYKFFIDSVAPRCLFPSFPCDSYENFLQGKCFHCPNRKSKAIRSDSVSQDL
jgi:Lipase